MAAKMLQLRNADGKVLVIPVWDYRPAAPQALPLRMRVPSRALERVLQYWTKHSLTKATGESRESLARWDADFQHRLEEDGLAKEVSVKTRTLVGGEGRQRMGRQGVGPWVHSHECQSGSW
ncbi:hypothetical protein ZWY2020_009490 [Hordeum vulgare]|nr:hypothetical protein ZWY2020_009490 [Hordeum vulgare]